MLDLFLRTRRLVKLAQVPEPNETVQAPVVAGRDNRGAASIAASSPAPTARQYGRWGAIGAGAGLASLGMAGGIEGGKFWFPRAGEKIWGGAGDYFERAGKGGQVLRKQMIFHPRAIARSLATGMLFATAVPAARRIWDVHTAKRSPEKF